MAGIADEYKRKYHFFLTELLKGITEERGYVVELMRAATNIKDVQKLTLLINPSPSLSEEEELNYWNEMDTTIIFALNLNAAQLREVLKLFSDFIKTKLYTDFKATLSLTDLAELKLMEETVDSYNKSGNIMHDTLIPLRNLIFHYNDKEAVEWVENIFENEKKRKPRETYIDIQKLDFGPGIDYNLKIYSDYIFMPKQAPLQILKFQESIIDLQSKFIHFVQILSKYLLKRAGIKKREFDWGMEYFYGYHQK